MKNFAAKLFLTITAVMALSAAALATTTGSESLDSYLAASAAVENVDSSTGGDLVNTFLGMSVTCWKEIKFKDGTVLRHPIPCPKK